MLLDPEDMSLRGTILGWEARHEAGLSNECEGRYAGSLWCIPSLSHFWQHYGGRVLEADLECAGGRVEAAAGQRAAHQCGAGPKNGHQGCGVDRRLVTAWAVARQFCAAASEAGNCGR